MMQRWTRHLALALSLCLVLLGAREASAQAENVWRLAGTFNGWNANDSAWTMSPVPGEDGVFVIERPINRGSFEFKFVRNGNWAEGHFGAGADNTLEMPGDDIRLTVRGPANYRIVLDTRNRRWSMDVAEVEEPLLVARTFGTPQPGRAFTLDLTDSLLPDPPETDTNAPIRITSPEQTIAVEIEGPLLYSIVPTETGVFGVEIEIDSERGVSASKRLTMESYPLFSFVLRASDFETEGHLEYFGRDTHMAFVDVERNTNLREIVITTHEGAEAFRAEGGRLAAGRYAMQVHAGGVVMNRDPREVPCLHRGHWVEFAYRPSSEAPAPETVHLAGSFNAWMGAGTMGAIEMRSRADRSFHTVLDLPDGAHEYQFILDGERRVADPAGSSAGEQRSVVVVGPTAAEFPPVRVGHINTDAIRHTPMLQSDVLTISSGLGLAEIAVATLPGDVDGVWVQFGRRGAGAMDRGWAPMERTTDGAGFDRWTARIKTGQTDIVYAFAMTSGPEEFISRDYRARLRPDPLQIPDWAMGAVWYQIFPERFRNANPLNDPHRDSIFFMPWDADWYDITEEEYEAHRIRYNLAEGEPLEERTGGDLFHVVWDRRYGGDLQGIVEKLDDLKELGITALYLNPVFEGESMHKYDATDFRHIDFGFGMPPEAGRIPAEYPYPSLDSDPLDETTWEWTAADRYFVDVFLPEAKKRGIRVVIDGVWNHTGRAHWAFQDVVKNGADSEYADWFFARFDEEGNLASWVAWDGPSGWLPKFSQTPDRNLIDPVKEHIFAVTRRWMDPNGDGDPSDGIDGWRLDVPLDIGEPFWVEWRELVKSINPDAIIIAEIWHDANRWMQGQHFDTQMHYPFARPVTEWLAVRPGMTSDELIDALVEAFDEAPQTNLIHQNLFASHDTDRYVSMLYNPGREYDAGNRIQDGDDYKDTRPPAEIYQLSLLGVAIQATYEGAPMVYYGDEVGMWGADDPTNRKPFPWPDTPPNRNPDDRADMELREQYARWLNLRHDDKIGPVLRYGRTRHHRSGNPDVFIFDRILNDLTVRVAVNKSDASFDAAEFLPVPSGARVTLDPVSAGVWVIRHDPHARVPSVERVR